MEKSGIEPDRQRLQGAAGAIPVIPKVDRPGFEPGNLRNAIAALCQLELAAHRGAAPGTGLSPGVAGLSFAAPHQIGGRMAPAADAHAMEMSIYKPIKGMQGPQELNPHSARVGAESPIRWLIPR